MARIPKLRTGNCLLFSVLFWLNNPKAKIQVRWNKRRKVPSFIPILDGKQYIYKPKECKQKFRLIFKGKIIII